MRLVPVVLCAALAAFGCTQEFHTAGSDVTVLFQGGESPTGPTVDVCAPVASVEAGCPVGEIAIGETVRCDATPLDAVRQERPDACNLAEGIQWTNSSPTVCDVPGLTTFSPLLTGAAPGVCVLQATVAGVPSPAVTVVVR